MGYHDINAPRDDLAAAGPATLAGDGALRIRRRICPRVRVCGDRLGALLAVRPPHRSQPAHRRAARAAAAAARDGGLQHGEDRLRQSGEPLSPAVPRRRSACCSSSMARSPPAWIWRISTPRRCRSRTARSRSRCRRRTFSRRGSTTPRRASTRAKPGSSPVPIPNLESDVRREAERQVRQAALDGGILLTAAANARTTLTTFLKGLGFETVQFR